MQNPAVRPRVRDDLICRQVDEDFVVYDPVRDNTILLNLSAAVVFELCNGARTVGEIVAAVAQSYSKDARHLQDDVESMIECFGRQGLFVADLDQ